MKNPHPKIIAFSCNWSPYACLNKLGIDGKPYPQGINIIHVTCAGRINTAHLLKPFLGGADGIMILRCREKHCHYGPGPENVKVYIEKTESLFELFGIEPERYSWNSYMPNEDEKLKADLESFYDTISKLEPFKKKYGNAI